MPRAIWKGSVTFGLVNIPVELHTAVRDARPRFRLLHARDKSPVSYQRVCQRDGKPVAWEDLVKGYEYDKGQFVTLTKDDFQTAALEKTRTVDILDFVEATAIDDRFYEQPYYLLPAKGAERPYALLREALRKTGRAGIAKFIMRDVQHLTSIQAVDEALVLTTMRFGEELVDTSEWTFPATRLAGGRELDLAVKLVESLAAEWAPDRYKDEYNENLRRIIQGKLKNKKVSLTEEEIRPHAQVIDLMTRLQASLEKRGVRTGPASVTRMKVDKPAKGRKTVTSRARKTVEVAPDEKPARARGRKRAAKSKRGSKVA
jgi:DNA end-binding protein Ku